MLLTATMVKAQINIQGNVYGGARQANVGGSTHVEVGAQYRDVIINAVFGGSDISGNIGKSKAENDTEKDANVTTYKEATGKHLFIGQLYGGGNGYYNYSETKNDKDEYVATDKEDNTNIVATSTDRFVKPELQTAAVNITGGTFGYIYGGGNDATIKEQTTITINNTSDRTKIATETGGLAELTVARLKDMGINTEYYNKAKDADNNIKYFLISRVFGGNNKADMAIKPTWNLMAGSIENLYSGGNEGRMTNPQGLLLDISADRYTAVADGTTLTAGKKYYTSNTGAGEFTSNGEEVANAANEKNYYILLDRITVDNVYGGCRKADVHPLLSNGTDPDTKDIQLTGTSYKFPAGLPARVVINGGDINNVYGGNDVSGRVYGGNAIGIHTNIRGNVYGGGNGSYAYTDRSDFEKDLLYGDFYYNPADVLSKAGVTLASDVTDGMKSAEALNLFRPNAEQVSIRVSGTKSKPVIIHGSVYCGGNSATLKMDEAKALDKTNYPNYPMVELKIGSHTTIDNVFLGNNGENMVTEDILTKYAGNVADADNKPHDFSSMTLTDANEFAKYMDGCAMDLIPSVTFDNEDRDGVAYEPYTSYIGSFFCGGNRGSMTYAGTNTQDFSVPVYVYTKIVGGCNNAVIKAGDYNADYFGGIKGSSSEQGDDAYTNADGSIKDRLILNFGGTYTPPSTDESESTSTTTAKIGIQIKPMRWNSTNTALEWNTVKKDYDENGAPIPVAWDDDTWAATGAEGETTADITLNSTINRRFDLGNIYGGCFDSGYVNGNVVINLNATIIDRDSVFDKVATNDATGEALLYGHNGYTIVKKRSGVILDEQGMDVLGKALNVFGGGKGKDTEIWGSTTINLRKGYTFQIFGGSQEGAIGKGTWNKDTKKLEYGTKADERYSCTINVHGERPGKSKKDDSHPSMAEAEFIYGGSFEGIIMGNTTINLGDGRVFNTFAGSCNADILGHTETHIGQWTDASGKTVTGFPWVRDHLYGGNDLGGDIKSSVDFKNRVRNNNVLGKVYDQNTLKANAYIEYIQGRVDAIFGGCYGDYDYSEGGRYHSHITTTGVPHLGNAFVNFRPAESVTNNASNKVSRIYGAGQGQAEEANKDKMQDASYVLIDIPNGVANYANMEIFGGGAYGGVGMYVDQTAAIAPKATATIDLINGQVKAAYGASHHQGVTRRTMVNVPTGSTINIQKIFGGAYGDDNNFACDAYEANVNYSSRDARVTGAIYGGNNNARRTLYGFVNINDTVWSNKAKGYQATVYGAGYGVNTWSQYTEVNLNSKANVYEVYGGGENGQVLNTASVAEWESRVPGEYAAKITQYESDLTAYQTARTDYESDMEAYQTAKAAYDADPEAYLATEGNTVPVEPLEPIEPTAPIKQLDISLGGGYTDNGLANALTEKYSNKLNQVDTSRPAKYNTNVHIHTGATVEGYAYGGGLGNGRIKYSGNVYGTTYIDLLGGKVNKDLYAAGTTGAVKDSLGVKSFVASSTAYIEGGTARNVYGGGWKGSVGQHNGDITQSYTDDIPGETHVIIGKKSVTSFTDGLPAIERNAYGGGEGGAVFGTTNLTFYNGYIGYRYFDNQAKLEKNKGETMPYYTRKIGDWTGYYQEKLHDETWTKGDGTNRLKDSGCIFGGGYIDNSSVDIANVTMYEGVVRNSLFGGGEIAAIGRGVVEGTSAEREFKGIYKAGKTNVTLYDGHVLRNVFGGGRGYNNLGEQGNLYSDGYVFGQTEVNVFGGEIGTDEGVAEGDGNVFGGGDIGYVYSAYEKNGGLCVGLKDGKRYDDEWEGYYYKKEGGSYVDGVYTGGNWYMEGGNYVLTEDCKVLIEPHCKVTTAVTIDKDYAVGDFVPTDALNTLGKKTKKSGDTNDPDIRWQSLSDDGIIIHNAIFAGGNVSSGSDKIYANATTVFGNATASIHDVFQRDLITIGTGHTGGLYGDGNLTFVDGYRGLNITNYGTDYYNIDPEISLDAYNGLPAREQAYYELRYKCIRECTDNAGKTYHPASDDVKASTISADELLALFEGISTDEGTPMLNAIGEPDSGYWVENGVCSRYAGRIMNTIQRADFCGVFGSRMVMQGAQDRVPEIVDHNNYTINRVREVSLNKKTSGSTEHGNYFGIYNIVHFLGNLTSDVDFGNAEGTEGDIRTSNNIDTGTYGPDIDPVTEQPLNQTFYQWKKAHNNERKRNNGNSHNQLALASGVYLEIIGEKTEQEGDTIWGLITGVVELDLINVQTGIGGGFVYAKNEHGKRSPNTSANYAPLTALNKDAITRRKFTYSTTDADKVAWETSGNFVHSTQTIIDDCYPISSRYAGTNAVKAHYWYIKGQVYVYDQVISAYTGAPNAYSEAVNIPLTITAASHGTMKLLDVRTSRYAYYSTYNATTQNKLGKDETLVINETNYHINDPISYWDWYLLSPAEKNLFVEETYTTIAECKIGEITFPKDTVLLPSEYLALKNANSKVYHVGKQEDVDFDFVFRQSNNMGHDTGYILTYDVTNPSVWNDWYTPISGSAANKIQVETDGYNDGPTYQPTANGLYGQHEYEAGDIISEKVYTTYQTAKTAHAGSIPSSGQAEFERAYIVTKEVSPSEGKTFYEGASVSEHAVTAAEWTAMTGSVAEAFVCTSTIKFSEKEYLYMNTRMTAAEKAQYITDHPKFANDINKVVVPAYYCYTRGLYGGDYYEAGKNYRGLEAWSSMSDNDRKKFEFNYDALDLLIDPDYGKRTTDSGTTQQAEGVKYQYDGKNFTTETQAKTNKAGYSLISHVDYTATYDGAENLSYTADDGTSTNTNTRKELTRTEFESLPNERHHFAPITVSGAGKYYVVNQTFNDGKNIYTVGTTVSADTYTALGDYHDYIDELTFGEDAEDTYYYCREKYTVGSVGQSTVTGTDDVTGASHTGTYASGAEVPVGLVISEENYKNLVNKQLNFVIHGIAPVETTTLYVSRNSDIFDLSQDRIITVIYQYDYEESDEQGLHITPVSERHVVNIRVKFKSGVPEVEDITAPQIVLPGTTVSLREPNVKPGAYVVSGGGWELFEKERDAESHTNGIEYTPGSNPLYWYQNGYYVAYYAKSYLGKTYSNHVQVSVANYHDLAKVMGDVNHYYVDNPKVKRNSKIYINDYSEDTTPKNGLDLLKDFYDLSLIAPTYDEETGNVKPISGGKFDGQMPVDEHVKGGADLEFILRTDIDHSSAKWSPLGDATQCFAGNLHGDGHYISGLSNSLFGHLCGSVYNLGVIGPFKGAGIAETGDGYVENCWIKSISTAARTTKPVFGNPTKLDDTTRPLRIVNCYYDEEDNAANKYTNHSGSYGIPTRKPDKAFYNGEVAYNLNGFYLNKRYYDNSSWTDTKNSYYYFGPDDDGKFSETPTKAYYPDNYGYYLLYTNTVTNKQYFGGYVEDRYYNGDFIYENGEIPDGTDERIYYNTETERTEYCPVWPDDYIFFGQALNYGHVDGQTHQDVPSSVIRSGGRILIGDGANRVYRAPAYFRSKDMGVAHFNSNAVFAKSKKDAASVVAYKNMTAIDFTGGNGDITHTYTKGDDTSVPYDKIKESAVTIGAFYPPLLDDDGLTGFQNVDLTKNLLVYTGAPGTTAAGKTATTVKNSLHDNSYAETHNSYRTVDFSDTENIKGHWVQLSGDDYLATTDQQLVDKQDFNAPIAYDFDSDHRMWYQREPARFVDLTKGWEGVSLPFTAEIVTTQDKGELTHFYTGSTTGHEYWLREFKGNFEQKKDENNNVIPSVYTANFENPAVGTNDKYVTNTFLWDYYYVDSHNHQDMRDDTYQTYYNNPRNYEKYPRLTAAVPYLIGFPGETYYEFDLSGKWLANTTGASNPFGVNDAQVITFASATSAHIGVSDGETTAETAGVTERCAVTSPKIDFTFKPSYMNESFDAGTAGVYTMKIDGSSYVKIPATTPAITEVWAFRPYFTASTVSGVRTRSVEQIEFSRQDNKFGVEEHGDPTQEEVAGNLLVYAKKHKIVVESALNYITEVRIVNMAGITVNTFSIEPGETVETRIYNSAVYIVQTTDGLYNKKLAVR